MAKVTGPLFSIDASGKFADSLVFSKWKGLNIVRQYSKPSQNTTAKQEAVKKSFSAATAMYQRLSGEDKDAWNVRASGSPMSGYNLFVKKVMETLTTMRAFSLVNKVEPLNITSTSATISLNSKEDGEAIVLYGEKPGSFTESIPVSLLAGELDFEISGLNPAQDYYFRVVQEPIYLEAPLNISGNVEGTPETTSYGYKVTAINKAGETIPGEEVLIETGPALLDETNFIDLSWDPVEGAKEYAIYRTTSEGDPVSTGRIGTSLETSFADTGLEANSSAPLENTALDRQGETGDYHFATLV